MQQHTFAPIFLIAFCQETVEQDKQALFGSFGIGGEPVEGCYKGKKENSFVVPASASTRQHVLGIAKEYKQESVLFLDTNRAGFLCYTDGRPDEFIGEWQKVSESEAFELDGYTKIGEKYYACK